MSILRLLSILALGAVLIGCAHPSTPTKPPEGQTWSGFLSDDESAHSKQVAITAAQSPETWERFKPKRVTSEPLKLDASRAQVYLYPPDYGRVTVAIPSGGHVGWHSTYIAVELSRGSYDVRRMYESFWP
jgi:hypothetical protein